MASPSLGGFSESIGNYKGVMLCNRPFGASIPFMSNKNHRSIPNSSKNASMKRYELLDGQEKMLMNPPFVSTTAKRDPIGMTPTKSLTSLLVKRPPADTAGRRHKQFLRKLQVEKEKRSKRNEEDERRKKENHDRFKEMLQKQRHMIINSKKNNILAPLHESEPNKPVWAMTEEEAEQDASHKVDDLLSFVKTLDFKSYIDNFEVQSALEAIQAIVNAETQKQKQKQNLLSEHSEKSNQGELDLFEKMKLFYTDHQDKETVDRNEAKMQDQLDLESVLSNLTGATGGSLKQIHSRKSIAKLINKENENTQGHLLFPPPSETGGPRIVTIHENERARLQKSKDVSNLPYMHRNPAV